MTGGAAGVDRTVGPSARGREEHTGPLPEIDRADQIAPRDARELTKVFFDRLGQLEAGSPEYLYTRNTLIEMNISLVRYVAGRYRNYGNGQLEDIVQVGNVALIKAIDRFDVHRGVEFSSFAVPWILGEIKRYFRDTTWAVHVPRRLQEFRIDLTDARERLAAALGRDPTVRELAEDLCVSEEDVVEGIVAANGYSADSLDTPQDTCDAGAGNNRGRPLADVVGDPDPSFETFEHLHALAPLLAELDVRDRRIIEMRFGEEMTQAAIGNALGISQMHVSRLIAQTLARLRRGLLAED